MFKLFKITSKNAILRENEHSFLGQRNENLNVYLLDKLNLNRVEKSSPVCSVVTSYFNKNFRKNYYKLKDFGFRSMDYSDNKYKNIFQRNIRFSLRTSILLDTNGEEALFNK